MSILLPFGHYNFLKLVYIFSRYVPKSWHVIVLSGNVHFHVNWFCPLVAFIVLRKKVTTTHFTPPRGKMSNMGFGPNSRS